MAEVISDSVGNVLVHYKEVSTIVKEDFTLEEFKSLFIEKSPKILYVVPYSKTVPCIYITKDVTASSDCVQLYYHAWAVKTPRLYTWEELYMELKMVGLEHIRF